MKTLSIVLTGVSLLLFIGSAASFFLNRKSRPISRRLLLLTGGFILVILLLELARRVDADGVLFPSSILVNTLQVFSLDFDYDDLFKQTGGTLSALQAFLLWYRGIVYSLAPIVGGAVILDVLAGISPDLQMFFSRRKKLYVFSELNELSVTLAEDVYRNRDNLGKPVIVFTDCYIDETREEESELFARARNLHAICLRDDISHCTVFRKSDYSCFFLMDVDDRQELDDQSNLTAFIDMVTAEKQDRVWNVRKIEKKIEKKEMRRSAGKDVEDDRQLKNNHIYFFSNDENALASFRVVASQFMSKEKGRGMPYFHSVRDYALSALHLLLKAPLYADLGPNEEGRPAGVAIFGSSAFTREVFKAVFSCGQMADHPLRIAVVYRPEKQPRAGLSEFERYLDRVSPEILDSCRRGSDSLKIDLDGNFGVPYASLCVLEEDPFTGDIRRFLTDKRTFNTDRGEAGRQPETFRLADFTSFIVMAGTDEENISLADDLRRALFGLGEKNKTISVLTQSKDMSTVAGLRVVKDGVEEKTLKLHCFGLLTDRFSWQRVARNGSLLAEQYAGIYAEEIISHGSDEFPETTNELYNEWSRVARSFHLPYKIYCAGIKTAEDVSPLERGIDEKIAYWRAVNASDNAALVDRLSWMEHRRWCAFLRTLGFVRPVSLLSFLAERFPDRGNPKLSVEGTADKALKDELRPFALKNVPARLHPCLVESRPVRTEKMTADLLDLVNQIRMVHDNRPDKQKLQYDFPPVSGAGREQTDYCELKRDDMPLGKNSPCFTLLELGSYLKRNGYLTTLELRGDMLAAADLEKLGVFRREHPEEFREVEKPRTPNQFYVGSVLEKWPEKR